MAKRIDLARDFSRFPFGRTAKHSPYSGERFREEWLLPALRRGEDVIVVLDGARGLGPSFLEEAFGGLLRTDLPAERVLGHVTIVSEMDPSRKVEVERYMQEEAARAAT